MAFEKFEAELDRATAALEEFSDGLDGAAKGGSVGGGGGGGGGLFGGGRGKGRGGKSLLGKLGGGALAIGSALEPGIGNFATTGNLTSAVGAQTRAGVSALASVPILGAALGAQKADRILSRTEGRVGSITGDLARYGVEVSDEFRKQQVKVAVEQETRVEEELGRVRGETGSLEALQGASRGTPLADIAGVLKEIRDDIKGFAGGSGR